MSVRAELARIRSLSSSPSGPPDDLVGEARRRLRWACFIYATGFVLAYGVPRVVFAGSRGVGYARTTTDLVTAVAVALALGLGLSLRPGRTMKASQFFLLGLSFEVVGALGIAVAEYWVFFMPEHVALGAMHGMHGISWVCVWVVIYPALVPAPLRRTVVASVLAAATTPLVLLASYLHFAPSGPAPDGLGMIFTGVGIANGTAAVLAIFMAKLIHGLASKVREARQLGSYRLTNLIGKGGMGEVWQAEHRLLARPAAVKLVRPEALETGDRARALRVLKRFEREAQATAQLRCPHSVSLYDFGISADGTFYYVMELLEGVTLETLVERYGPQPAERVVFLLRQICCSLEEAHQRGLIHRDVKPANIFCCRYGLDVDFVKVLDFGLVKWHSDPSQSGARLTADGAAAGTPAYMAPESIVGEPTIGPTVDLYALGCLAYWLLTGRLVFEASTPVRMALMHVEEEPLPPSVVTELEVPEALDRIVVDCLRKEPAERPQTASEIIARLDAIRFDHPWNHERALGWWAKHMPTESVTGSFVSHPSAPSPALAETDPAV